MAVYVGKLVEWVRNVGGWSLELVRPPPHQNAFEVTPRRRVVERAFAWLGKYPQTWQGLPGTAADHRSLDLRSHDRADAPPPGTGLSPRLRWNRVLLENAAQQDVVVVPSQRLRILHVDKGLDDLEQYAVGVIQ